MAEKMNYSDTGAAKAVNQQTPRTQKALSPSQRSFWSGF